MDCTVVEVKQEKGYELLSLLEIGYSGKVGLKVLVEW